MDKHLENGFKQVKKLSFATLFLNEDKSILMIKYHEETVVDVEKSVLVIDAVFPFIEQGAIYGITDATAPFLNITPGARKNYRDNKSLQLSFAHAVVVKELSVRLMANFFAKFDKPVTTTKVFNDFESALDWLEDQKLKVAN